MSGGSYDYAFSKIQEMAETIRQHGNCSAASPTLLPYVGIGEWRRMVDDSRADVGEWGER
jgi:hypothetical protein